MMPMVSYSWLYQINIGSMYSYKHKVLIENLIHTLSLVLLAVVKDSERENKTDRDYTLSVSQQIMSVTFLGYVLVTVEEKEFKH